jgi:hypothetical protein
MTPLGKTLFVTLGLAVLIGGMLALRSEPDPVTRVALTPAQVAELQPPAKPMDPPKAAPVSDAGDQALPPEPEIEDGSGS